VWSPSQAAARRAAKRKSTYYIGIDASAFVGILLALLFLLMGDTTPDRNQKGSVDLPAAKNAALQTDALREDAMLVAVTRDGRIYFLQTNIGSGELAPLIRKALDEGSRRKIFLAVDRRARNVDVRLALEQIKLAGVTDVVILTVQPRDPIT
jgi:biopolymer transport protein TolR